MASSASHRGPLPPAPGDFAGHTPIQICQNNHCNSLLRIVGHFRVKPDIVSVMVNHQVAIRPLIYKPQP
jgi:hypothetical protein